MPDPVLHPDPNLTPSGYGLIGVIIIGLWEALRYGAKAIRFPRPKALDSSAGTRLDKLTSQQSVLEGQQIQLRLDLTTRLERAEQQHSALRSDFNTYRDVEFPSHANRIRSVEIALREVQDRQNEMMGLLESNGAEQKDSQRILRQLQGLMKQVQQTLEQRS